MARDRGAVNKRHRVGKEHPLFKNGKTKDGQGYVQLSSKIFGPHQGQREHRAIMESVMGRSLLPNEIVHHINGDKSDNRVENLIVESRASHNRKHGNGKLLLCAKCGAKKWYSVAIIKRIKASYLCRTCWFIQRRGEGNPNAKILNRDAVEIRRLHAIGIRSVDIANRFNVSQQMICDIIKGRRYV